MVLNNESDCPESTTLDRLPLGVAAVVSRVDAADEELARLQAMGVCEGRPIHTMRGGSRMIVCAAGTRIGLDRGLASAVQVTVLPPVTAG